MFKILQTLFLLCVYAPCHASVLFSDSFETPMSVNIQIMTDISYGEHQSHKLDVYKPSVASNAPTIFMVHGGAWRMGDKAAPSVVENKVNRWVAQGFVFISVNYRLSNDITPLMQAQDVAQALAYSQQNAEIWGANPNQFILMGHSAGAHLISIISSSPEIATARGATTWLGSVAIDSAAYDVVHIMQNPHPAFYDPVFGIDVDFWASVSPLYLLESAQQPFLAVCSTQRLVSCQQASAFVEKAISLNMQAQKLPVDFSHQETNVELGVDQDYTEAVELFMSSLSDEVQETLNQ